MAELERRKVELADLLAATPETAVRVHPGIARVYRAEIGRIAEAMGDGDERGLAAELLRGLIDKAVLIPREGGGLDAELHGERAAILALCEAASGVSAGSKARKQKRPSGEPEGRLLSVAAGRCSHLYRTEISWPSQISRVRAEN